MKISRKMKKFFVTFLTATLSIIMLVTSASALNAQTSSEWFEHESLDALEYMTWDPSRDWFIFGVDLTCYDGTNVQQVDARLDLTIYYIIDSPSIFYSSSQDMSDDGIFTYENTWDSDELLIHVTDFDCGYAYSINHRIEIEAEITYIITYSDGSTDICTNNHYATISNGSFG